MNTGTVYKSAVKWKGERCDMIYHVTSDFTHLPNDQIEKAYGVCFKDNKMLVVYHSEWDIWGIPGGTREKEEEVLQTLKREIYEESSYTLLNATPLAYQHVTHSNGTSYYTLIYYCDVDSQGTFEKDIAGSITKSEWIEPEEYHTYIEEKPFRKAVIETALHFRKKRHE